MRLILNCFKSFAIRKFCTALPEPPLKSFPTPRVGLELGLTNCRVAVFKNQETEVIKNGSNTNTIPSVVAIAKNDIIVGDEAIRHKNSENVFFMMELLIGKKFNDPIVQIIRKNVKYNIVEASNGDAGIKAANGKIYAPTEMCSLILQKLSDMAEDHLKACDLETVITVPSYFDDWQRIQIELAAKLAQIKIVKIVSEHEAVALSNIAPEGNILAVCGMELGILSISILTRQNGLFEVKFTSNINLIDNTAFKNFPHFKKPNGHLTTSHIDKIMCLYAKALIDAKMDKKEIDDVILIGTLASDRNYQFRQRMADTMFGRKPLIAKAEDISIGAAMHCEVFALRFPSKYYDAVGFMKEAEANLVLEVPDTVSSCENVWKAVQDTIRLLYAKMGIWVYKHHSSKHLLLYASTYAPTVKDAIVIRYGFDASQTSHHYGYNSGLPDYVIKNYFVTINVLLAEIRSLDHNEVRKGLEGFLKDVDDNGARKIKEMDLNIPKLEVLIEDLNRSIIGEVKKEEQKELGDLNQGVEVKKKGKVKRNKNKDLFKLVKIPQFHQIINGDVYKLSYAAI
uniref:Uncharacterized protein n=1 Tax=Meloidogyne javanica TaxID=6303 RepID=A0A915M1Z3_MELJA